MRIASQMTRTSLAIARALDRLSTGKRVSSPRDDSAAYSMSQKLDSQARGIAQGIQSLNQSQGELELASSGIQSQLDIIRRMREIAVTASSSSITSTDRANLKKELQQLVEDYRRLSSSSKNYSINLGRSSDDTIDQTIQSTQVNDIFKRVVGSGNFAPRQSAIATGSGLSLQQMKAVDFNNDGALDLIGRTSSAGEYRIYMNNGHGTFSLGKTTDFIALGVYDFEVKDINDDDKLDIVGLDGSGVTHYWFGNGDGTFQNSISVDTSSTAATAIRLGDVDQDGDIDAMYSDGTSLYMARSDGSSLFSEMIETGFGPTVLDAVGDYQLEDINGDGKVDIVLADGAVSSGQIQISLGTGGGSFATATTYATGLQPTKLKIADMNRDGKKDIISLNYSNFTITTFLGNGSGTVSARSTITLTNIIYQLDVADMNGDGILDLLVQGATSVSTGISLGIGDGTYQTFLQDKGRQGSIGVVAADFDRDGIVDIMNGVGAAGVMFQFNKGLGLSVTDVSSIDVSTEAKAESLIRVLDDAIVALEKRSGEITALHSRLDETSAHQALLQETLEEAKSTIESSDLILETAELARLQILQQAQMAVHAHGPISMSLVLKLLM